jgi:3-hydroxyacyl-CoA dehydrogenase
MSNVISIEREGDVAVVVIDKPPVNAIGQDVYDGMMSAFQTLAGDTGTKAVVIVCAGRTFIAGADIKLLEQAARGEGGRLYLHDLLEKIEDFPRPVIVALHALPLGAAWNWPCLRTTESLQQTQGWASQR